MKKAVFLAALVHYFKSYPDSNECHAASDGMLFHEKQMAQSHADTGVGDGTIQSYTRSELPNYEAELKKEKGSKKEDNGGDGEKEYADMTKAELAKLLTERQIEFDKKAKQEDLVALLEKADADKQ